MIIFLRFWFVFFLVSLAARIIIYIDTNIDLSLTDYVTALNSDALASIAPAILSWLLSKKIRYINIPLVFMWCLLHASNMEFISEFMLNINIDDILMALSNDFIAGSIQSTSFIYGVTILAATAACTHITIQKIKPGRIVFHTWISFILLSIVHISYVRTADLSWHDSHFLEEYMYHKAFLEAPPISNARKIRGKAISQETFARNLDAPRILPTQPNLNILMVTIEGLSQQHVQRGWMPHLKELTQQGWHYTQVVNPNLVTINGMVALTCGLANLGRHSNQRLKQLVQNNKDACLPNILNQKKYYTEYIQAAGLRFQNKANFMATMGFQRVLGKDELPKGKQSNAWGMNDLMLYQHVKERIREANIKGQPWFIQTLSVSTHHPYQAPKDFMPDTPRMQRAYRFADHSILDLYRWLEKEHILKNTLLIITGDESRALDHGRPDGTYLGNNHGFFLIIAPDLKPAIKDHLVMQTDLAISILDYLGVAEETTTSGRSIFREYVGFRPLLFSNSFGRRTYGLFRPNMIIRCGAMNRNCNKLLVTGKELFYNNKSVKTAVTRQEREKINDVFVNK